jgi:hypothetical protein
MYLRQLRHLLAIIEPGSILCGALLPVAVLLGLIALRPAWAEPVKTHPRLWLRAADIPELRSRMTSSNPVWVAFESVVQDALNDWSSDKVPELDGGTHTGNSNYKSEHYAMVFAFMSLLETDPTRKQTYIAAARECLMYVMDRAALGPGTADRNGLYPPFRHPDFIMADRGFSAEAFAFAVDWLQAQPGALSVADMGKIRKSFLWWGQKANEAVYFSPWNPNGLVNDPVLLRLTPPAPQNVIDQRLAVREALNNHYANRLKMMILMPLALDPADDVPVAPGDDAPPGALTGYTVGATPDEWVYNNTGYLRLGTGGWLYQTDYALRHDGAGGGSQEGMEYVTNGLGPIAESLLMLYTAGQDDPQQWGPQVVISNHPFWDKALNAFLHHLPPAPRVLQDQEWRGPQFELAWFGDGELYGQNDQFIKILAPLALYDYYRLGTMAPRTQAVRYIQTHLAPGGADKLADRISGTYKQQRLLDGIAYFLLFDPAAPAPVADPRASRPATELQSFDDTARMGAIFARTGDGPAEAYLDYRLGWNLIDHQHGDGNSFELWRNGVWLTKRWVGYGGVAENSDYNNAMVIQNNPLPASNTFSLHQIANRHGSQYPYSQAGDPTLLAKSLAPSFVYVSGDATPLYNIYDKRQNVDDVLHASRDIVWLKPDFLVVYDRATTRTAGRFKRFVLAMPAVPRKLADTTHQTVFDSHAVGGVLTSTPRAELYTTTLLPLRAELSFERKRQMTDSCRLPSAQQVDCDKPEARQCLEVNPVTVECACPADGCHMCKCRDETASGEPMSTLLVVSAPGNPADARFLHVLQASDFGVPLVPASLVESRGGTAYQGAVVDHTAVLFKARVDAPFVGLNYNVPATTVSHLVTGLAPTSTYYVTQQTVGDSVSVTIDTNAGGTPTMTDSGGVLILGSVDLDRRRREHRGSGSGDLQPQPTTPRSTARENR